MNMINFRALIALIAVLFVTNLNAKEFSNYKEFYDAFENLKVDKEHIYKVQDLVLMQDAATTVLDSGFICFMEDIHDGKHVAIFRGHGSFEVTPTLAVERANAMRHFGTEYYATEFEDASFIFDDDLFESISANSFKTSGVDLDDIEDIFHETVNSIAIKGIDYLQEGVVKSILETGQSEFFLAEFFISGSEQYIWRFDPIQSEECVFSKADITNTGIAGYLEPILVFDKQEDLILDENQREKYTQDFKVMDIDIKMEFYLRDNFETTTKMKVYALENFQWMKLYVNPNSEVVSVKNSENKTLGFYKKDRFNSRILWVNFPSVILQGDTVEVTITQKNDMQGQDAIFYVDLYPIDERTYDYKKFSLNVISSTEKDVFAFGNKIESNQIEDGRIQTKWAYPDSLLQIGVVFNNYKEKVLEYDEVPFEVSLNYNSTNNLDMIETNFFLGYQYFNSIFGHLDQKKLSIYQLPMEVLKGSELYKPYYATGSWDYGVVESEYSYYLNTYVCNDILALSPVVFNYQGLASIQAFIADLKKLWLNNFESKSDRDIWIMNGLNKFLEIVYFQNFYEDKSVYQKILDAFHKSFISLDNVNKGYEDYGSLGMGSIGDGRFRADGTAMYLKSFFIFHMLRNMFIDYQNGMSEQLFMTMIRDFYQTYKDKKYSVKDFQSVMEKHCGASLQWFFDQWVYGTAIPTYKFASKVVEDENGNYIVKCQMAQEDVPSGFGMHVPIKVEFNGGTFYATQVLMQGEKIKFDLGPFRDEPEDVICNPNYSVLSNTESKSWEDDF